MSKWTDWIPHEGDECPVDGEEVVKVKSPKGGTGKGPAKHWAWYGSLATLTHYKRLRKNVEAEKLDAEIDAFMEDDPEPSEATPAPIITGPGEYVTRDGRKATVEGSRIDVCGGVRFMGDVSGNVIGWDGDGLFCAPDHHPCDITGPWQEDTADTKAETRPEKPETKPERWANLYRHEDGKLHLGWTVCNSSEKVLGCRAADCVSKHIGAVLLNPEEE